MHISDATDLWLADLARRRRAVRTIGGYRGYLNKLDDQYRRRDVNEITTTDLRHFVDRWANGSASTNAQIVSIMHGFFGWLAKNDYVDKDPSLPLERPPQPDAVDRDDITYITTDEVRRMFAACEDWTDTMTVGVLALTGVRREAAAQFRLIHWDRERGAIAFTEKGARGGRVIRKPMPDELAQLIEAAETAGVYKADDDFVIPPRASLRRSDGTRSASVLLKTVKRIGARAGITDVHVHAFRAAFAVEYLRSQRAAGHGDGDNKLGLQMNMGHKQGTTTDIYLRRLDRQEAMEPLRGFSFGVLPALPDTLEPATTSSGRTRTFDGDIAPVHPARASIPKPGKAASLRGRAKSALDSQLGVRRLTEKEGFEPSTDPLAHASTDPVELSENFDLLDLIAGRHVDAPPPHGEAGARPDDTRRPPSSVGAGQPPLTEPDRGALPRVASPLLEAELAALEAELEAEGVA